jgi:hypothetical protein
MSRTQSDNYNCVLLIVICLGTPRDVSSMYSAASSTVENVQALEGNQFLQLHYFLFEAVRGAAQPGVFWFRNQSYARE